MAEPPRDLAEASERIAALEGQVEALVQFNIWLMRFTRHTAADEAGAADRPTMETIAKAMEWATHKLRCTGDGPGHQAGFERVAEVLDRAPRYVPVIYSDEGRTGFLDRPAPPRGQGN